MFKACIGFRSRRIEYLDRTHCSLVRVPEDVYRNERWLEELILDMNMIQELPPKFFRLTNLRKFSACENEILRLPVAIGNLVKLVDLNLSKNSIEELPESLASCRSLAILDFSMNPLMKAPDVLSSIPSLTQLMLNDVALQRLPTDIGNLENLVVLEARENLLKLLPTSIGNLRKLQRLDLGNNEIEELPPHIGQLEQLEELWLDINSLTTLPQEITQLSNLIILDLTKNRLSTLPSGLDHMLCLKDLIMSENFLESVPSTLGHMRSLYQLKLDMNRLFQLPDCFEGLVALQELFLYDNLLEALPPSIFKMGNLRLLNADRNHLVELPKKVAGASKLHVLSLRDNELTEIPDDICGLSQLTVLDVCGNRLGWLPATIQKLQLEALWLIDNQPQPLMQLHEEEGSKTKLICSLLPQKGPYNLSMENFLADSDAESNTQRDAVNNQEKHDRQKGLTVAFDPSAGPPEDGGPQSKLVRFPTPARRKGRGANSNKKHKPNLKGDAPAAPSIFKKTRPEDAANASPVVTTPSTELATKENDNDKQPATAVVVGDESPTKIHKETGVIENMRKSPSLIPNGGSLEAEAPDILPHIEEPTVEKDVVTTERPPSAVSFSSDTRDNEGKRAQMQRKDTPHNLIAGASPAATTSNSRPVQDDQSKGQDVPSTSTLQTVVVEVELVKETGRSLGFSIAGGKGSMPAYEDVDDGVFITKIAPGGLAEIDGRLRLGDRLLSVNGTDMTGISHSDAVEVLKGISDHCCLVVSREVLIVLPENIASPPAVGKQASPPPSDGKADTASPPPEGKADTASPPPEGQINQTPSPPVGPTDTTSPPPEGQTATTPPPEVQVQISENSPSPAAEVQVQISESSPPPAGQKDKTPPPQEGETNRNSPPLDDHGDTGTTTETAAAATLQISQQVVESTSMNELRDFGEGLSEAATFSNEVVEEVVTEDLLQDAPPLEDIAGDDKTEQEEEKQPEEQPEVNMDDFSDLEGFAEQLRLDREKEAAAEIVVMEEDKPPRDNYVNFDIAHAVITSPSNVSLNSEEANSKRDSVTSSDLPGASGDAIDQADSSEIQTIVKSKPTTTVEATAEDAAPTVASVEVTTKKTAASVTEPVVEEVILMHGTGPLGMNIVGGSDRSSFPFGKGQSGVFISKVVPVGAAADTKKLNVGDQILKVNGWDTRGQTHQEVVDVLIKTATSGSNTVLLIQHDPAPPGLVEVKLAKGPNEKLGISIRGGERTSHNNDSEDEGISVKGFHGNPFDAEDEGIFISKVSPGGVAAQDGRLRVGQRILEVNGQSLVGASHVAAVRIMKDIQEELTLVVCNGFDPSSEEHFGSTSSVHMIHGPPSVRSSVSGGGTQLDHQLIMNKAAASTHSPIDVTVTEEKLDEMLKELEDINKSIASPSSSSSSSSSSSEDEETDLPQVRALSPKRKLSKSASTPMGVHHLALSDNTNLVTTTSLSTGELNTEASEALKSIHDEMDKLQQQVNQQAEAMLQSSRKRRNSRNYADYEWAEREKKRLEQKAQELMERTRASQEAARKKQEDNEKKVREEAEKLAQQRKEEHDKIVKEAAKKMAQEQIHLSPAEHRESLASMITEIFDEGTLQSEFDQFNELEFPDKYDTAADYMTAESSDLFTITSSDKTTPEHNKGDNEDMDDIVKALTDFSAGNNNGETDDDSLLENNIVTISYTQTSPPSTSPDHDKKEDNKKEKDAENEAKKETKRSSVTTITVKKSSRSESPPSSTPTLAPTSSSTSNIKDEKPPPVTRRDRKGQKNNPERLSFVERLQLHEKAVKEEAAAANKIKMNRSSSAQIVGHTSAARPLQKKLAASSEQLDDVENISDHKPIFVASNSTGVSVSDEKQKKRPKSATTTLTVSSVRTTSPPSSTETTVAPTEPSQNRYVQQVLENMPPVVTCSHSDSDNDDLNDMEGLTPAQTKVLQAQQRRLWRTKKEAELNDAVHKAQTAIDQAKEQDSKSHTTTITVKTTSAAE
ncbi:protein scribble homolog isoform X3 [Dysidea avara]|uniref:protein scribble homolog isoform X3 n=1 Tax=Dysidea avara TaxID=196820 RepID=UPI0033171FFF